MATYLFAWNPNDWKWKDLARYAKSVQQGTAEESRWSIGRYKSPGIGDRFFLIRLGAAPKGLMGSGHITSNYYEDTHYKNPNKTCNYVDIKFDYLVDANKSV